MESKYERLRRVGIGSYGIVFKCVNRQTGQIVAIKRYSENDSDPIIRKIAIREVRMLRQLKHPNLINLIEVFRRKRRLHLVFDYCELTLLDVIEKYNEQCPVALIKKVIWQTVNGINYCHAHNCVHRDIKPENILICQSGIVKLCDFGFARSLYTRASISTSTSSTSNISPLGISSTPLNDTSNTITTRKFGAADIQSINKDTSEGLVGQKQSQSKTIRQALTEYVATRWYRAPELLIGDAFYDTKIDIWAIGCVTSELMRGEPMWPGKTDLDQLTIIKNSLGQLTSKQSHTLMKQAIYDPMSIDRLLGAQIIVSDPIEQKLPPRVGKTGIDFVVSCLRMDQNARPSSDQLLKHPFINSARVTQFISNNGSNGFYNNDSVFAATSNNNSSKSRSTISNNTSKPKTTTTLPINVKGANLTLIEKKNAPVSDTPKPTVFPAELKVRSKAAAYKPGTETLINSKNQAGAKRKEVAGDSPKMTATNKQAISKHAANLPVAAFSSVERVGDRNTHNYYLNQFQPSQRKQPVDGRTQKAIGLTDNKCFESQLKIFKKKQVNGLQVNLTATAANGSFLPPISTSNNNKQANRNNNSSSSQSKLSSETGLVGTHALITTVDSAAGTGSLSPSKKAVSVMDATTTTTMMMMHPSGGNVDNDVDELLDSAGIENVEPRRRRSRKQSDASLSRKSSS